MSTWLELDLERRSLTFYAMCHTLHASTTWGAHFSTAYQLAIDYARRHPDNVLTIRLPIGGAEIR